MTAALMTACAAVSFTHAEDVDGGSITNAEVQPGSTVILTYPDGSACIDTLSQEGHTCQQMASPRRTSCERTNQQAAGRTTAKSCLRAGFCCGFQPGAAAGGDSLADAQKSGVIRSAHCRDVPAALGHGVRLFKEVDEFLGSVCCAVSGIAGVALMIGFFVISGGLLQPWLAPKIWLIEYAADLVRPGGS